nr:single-stranded-DNA-specific exonuclease RecJ [Algiphilus aromaticivorans]
MSGDAAAHLPLLRRNADGAGALPGSLHPVVRRVYAGRGVAESAQADYGLSRLLPPDGLGGLDAAADLLAEAVSAGRRICIAGDYDADGATSTALLLRGLRALGAKHLDHVIPDRFTMGYGLSPALVDAAHAREAEVLVTVDCGIANVTGVAHAQALGMQVIVTDHHLPGPELPAADAIVNPNLPGDGFPSKALAGVGVAFYLLAALRARLGRDRLALAGLLDLVALGTVADVVPLDHNNRVFVAQGLARIRAGRASAGINALLQIAGREAENADAATLGFVVGPRLNAAGRLENMGQGVACLLCDEPEAALAMAGELDALNRSRRDIEADMVAGSETARVIEDAVGICLYEDGWHEGVVGLVASRAKQSAHRPVIAFAPSSEEGVLKGSARSIPGLHIRDAIAAVDRAQPELIDKFGGHAMAAGLSLQRSRLEVFAEVFDKVCREQLSEADLEARFETDGALGAEELNLDTALALEAAGPWGQAFPEPVFDGLFVVRDARIVGSDHVRYRFDAAGVTVAGIDFGGAERMAAPGARVALVYQLSVNRFRGETAAQLLVRELVAIA